MLLYCLLVMIFLPPGFAFLFHEPFVQTLSGRLATHYLSKRIGNVTSIDALQIDLISGITLKGVIVKDHHDRTLMQIDKLVAKPLYADWGLLGIRFSKLELDGVEFRLAKYKGEDELNLIKLINKFMTSDTTEVSGKSAPFKLRSRKVNLRNALFQYYDEEMEVNVESKMDYSNIIFDSIYLTATKFTIVNDSLNFKIDSLFTNERSGIKISKLKSDFNISSTGLHAKSLSLIMNNSKLDLDFGFNYHSYSSYAYFIDSVNMYADIRPSIVMASDIGFFSKEMENMHSEVGITGKMNGTVSNLTGKDVRLHYGNRTRVSLDGQISGLPDFFNSYIVADIHELNTTASELKTIKLPLEKTYYDLTPYLKRNKLISLNGNFKGYLYNFRTKFDMITSAGHVVGTVLYKAIEGDTIHFDMTVKGDSVNIGNLLHQQELLGNVNFDINAKGKGKSFSKLKVKAGGTLRALDLLDYRYSRIRFSGRYYEDLVEANIVVGDHNLMMNSDIAARIADDPEFSIVADIRKANLEKLKLWEGYNFSISTNAIVMFKGFDVNKMTGSVSLKNSTLVFGDDVYELESGNLVKELNGDGMNVIDIKSDYADLNLTGKYELTSFFDKFNAVINHYLNALPEPDIINYADAEFADLTFTLHNDDIITDHFVPGMEISPNTRLNASVDFVNNKLEASSEFEKLILSGIEMKHNQFLINSKNNRLNILYSNQNTIFRDSTESDKTVFGLDNFKLKATALKDSLSVETTWDNTDSLLRNTGDVKAYYTIRSDDEYFKIMQSDIFINDTLWTIDTNNLVVFDSTGINFKNIDIYGGESKMNLSGRLPQKSGDSLVVSFDNWNLSNFDMVTKLWKFELDGIVDGNLQYYLVNTNPVLVSDLTIDKLFLNKVFLGRAGLFNSWDNESKSILIRTNIVREGTSGVGEVLTLQGKYFPFKEEDALGLDFSFNRIKIKALEPFFNDFISQIEGVAGGELKLQGSPDKPVLTGFIDMHRTQLLVNYLNTKYSFSNVINFEKDHINFGELVIYDTLGNFATVDGRLRHEYFQSTDFDVKISTDKLLAFNTNKKMNDLYYGTGLIAGNLEIGGTAKKIKMFMDVSTIDGTDVKLPLDYSVEISDKDYIIFIDHTDTLVETLNLSDKMTLNDEVEKLEYEIDMNLGINPQAKVTIYLPSDMGRIESEGRGDLKMKTNTNGDFSLIGDYVVEKGLFHFSLANLVRKRFELVEGGRISWTGDPYNANLSIKGLYRLKTNLSSLGLVVDSTTSYGNKVNVDCYIILTNQLLNPDIRFEILMPDLNPDMQRMVYANLDTTNQAMMNEQMISLLVLGSFSYSNASNISLSSSYYNVISNQLSNMLSKISDDFDIGVNYKPGDNVSQEEFEVALSTQLFDDRLMIDGNFGMTYDRSGQNASNIVGDVDIGYKITKDGQWILKAFNHSNVNSWYNYADYDKVAPYTQGVGIAFRREFTHISELFKSNKPPKGKMKKEDENGNETVE